MAGSQKNFGQDLEAISDATQTIVLSDDQLRQMIVTPQWQGRVMTSTANGVNGFSYGWVNHQRIASEEIDPQINLFGGEDRFWVSPEGSQFSFFFDPDVKMELQNWRTPPSIDIEPFELVDQSEVSATFKKSLALVNYSGQSFAMDVIRTVQLNSLEQSAGLLGCEIPAGVASICYETQNEVTNANKHLWDPKNGLPAVWILCMNKPSDHATVLVPFEPGSMEERGLIVNGDYFGKLDSKRLRICDESNLIFFVGDGQLRSKLGVSFRRAKNYMGAWDAINQCLTIVQFNLPKHVDVGYTNNLWKPTDKPYLGDVINSYNDGPNDSGGMMGPFYELETLSPALNLEPDESYTHVHRTFHLEGNREGLDHVTRHVFGVGLKAIEGVFFD